MSMPGTLPTGCPCMAGASLTGPGLNPWDRTRWSGGSSSGSGISVAAGLVPFALGSETNGSILTPREREVIKLLAEGNSVRKVADLLGLSAKTVEAHKFNLMRKLDIHNKAQLVTYAIQKKIVSVPVSA